MKPYIKFDDYMLEFLKKPEHARGMINEALEGGDLKAFLVVLQDVIRVHGGVTQVAKKTGRGRASLYKALSENGNPHFKNIYSILRALGLKLTVVADK